MILKMEASNKQLWALKALLNTFGESTGLKVNFAKSMMVPINISEAKLQHLARTFHYQTRSLPFYLFGPAIKPI